MNIHTYSSFKDGTKEQLLKNNWELYDLINQEFKSRIPKEHFYKLNLKLHENKGKYSRRSIKVNNKFAEGEYVAKTGADTDPYNCYVKINYYDIKRFWETNTHFKIHVLKVRGRINSFLEAYYYILFHELGHVVIFFNNFERYLEFIDDNIERDTLLDEESVSDFEVENDRAYCAGEKEEMAADRIGDQFFDLWQEMNN
jgi:hypothetical protein